MQVEACRSIPRENVLAASYKLSAQKKIGKNRQNWPKLGKSSGSYKDWDAWECIRILARIFTLDLTP